MDGTLIDSSVVIVNAINYVRSRLSLPPMDSKFIVSCINNTNIHGPSIFYDSQHYTKEQEVWFQEYYTDNHDKDIALYNGIKELLDELKLTHKMSVATNAYELSAKQTLKAAKISNYFDIVMAADIVKKAKPHREMIDKIVSYYGGDYDEFIMIGDGERDIMAAKNAGIDSILVDWGFTKHKNAIQDVNELKKILRG
jgi:phosphoglycolate phosphatase